MSPRTRVALALGGGHTNMGRWATGSGVNAVALLVLDAPHRVEQEIRTTDGVRTYVYWLSTPRSRR